MTYIAYDPEKGFLHATKGWKKVNKFTYKRIREAIIMEEREKLVRSLTPTSKEEWFLEEEAKIYDRWPEEPPETKR